jgi:hypothetical protein
LALAGLAEREFIAAALTADAGGTPGSREDGSMAEDDSFSEAKGEAAPVPVDASDDTQVWPDEAAEAAFIAETRGRGEPAPVATAEAVEEADARPLPTLDELVNRIPSETRELLDELFRVKFTVVRHVPRKALKE